jgi:hypothetical protein
LSRCYVIRSCDIWFWDCSSQVGTYLLTGADDRISYNIYRIITIATNGNHSQNIYLMFITKITICLV